MEEILTDRSRIESFLNCARQRYLGYEWQGIGLSRTSPSLPLLNGIAIHSAVDKIADNPDELEGIVGEVLFDWQQGFPADVEIPEGFLEEQEYLLEGLIRTWTTYRLPLILEEFTVVASEVEIPWTLTSEPIPVVDMVRCDKILRDSYGNLKILELKTTSTINDQWINGWRHNTQILANTLAVKETFNEECDGVMIEGLCKGMRKFDKKFNRIIQMSPLCYGWKKVKGDQILISPKYSSGWERFEVWKEFSAKEWFEKYIDEEMAREICCPIPPIKPTTIQLERWKKQTVYQEQAIRANREKDLDHHFPMNDGHCLRFWGYPCQFEEMCFNEQISADPIGSGIYTFRTPHHERELNRVAAERERLEKENQQDPGATEAAEFILGQP